jgi:hypothetical protein
MAAIAAFATSDAGRFHVLVSERFGLDPAAILADPVEAANLRAALFITERRGTWEPEPSEPDSWETAAEANKRAWLEGIANA